MYMKAHLVMVISKLSFFVGKPKLHRKNTLFPVLTFVGVSATKEPLGFGTNFWK